MAKKEKTEEPKEAGVNASINLLKGYLKESKDDHLNFEKQVDWQVSTGSLLFDVEQGGGYRPGAYKVAGASYGGKTHLVLECIRNGLNTVPKSKGLWIASEGRLDQKVKERSGIKFVYSAEEWEYGTCFVFETNVYEAAFDLCNRIIQVKNNPESNVYFMGIDSADALIRRDDIPKSVGEGEKVAAGGTLASNFFKKTNAIMNKLGHALFVIDQVRAAPKINQYEAANPNDSVGKGGPNATIHAANQIWYVKGRSKKNTIEEKGKVVGHKCVVGISKGLQERIDVVVEYPVKHGRKGGTSVWREHEMVDMFVEWEYVDSSGAWVTFSKEFIKELNDEKLITEGELTLNKEGEFKINGLEKFRGWLEQKPEVVDYFYKKFVKMFTEE